MRYRKKIKSKKSFNVRKRITKRGNYYKLKKGKFNRNKKGGATLTIWHYYDKIIYSQVNIFPDYPEQLEYLLTFGGISSLTTANQIMKLANKCVQNPTNPYCLALAALQIV